jgi:hypothetical protein
MPVRSIDLCVYPTNSSFLQSAHRYLHFFELKTIQSAYYVDLPSQGFDVCWVDTPSKSQILVTASAFFFQKKLMVRRWKWLPEDYSISDMQLSAEFVAYAVMSLAPQSTKTGGKISVVSYSQGGPNVSPG